MISKIGGAIIATTALGLLVMVLIVSQTLSSAEAGGKGKNVKFGVKGDLPGQSDSIKGPIIIKSGQTVNFKVGGSGFHRVAIYDRNLGPDTFRGTSDLETTFNSIDVSLGGGPLIDDPTGRLALGASPLPFTPDERLDGRLDLSFTFDEPGQYLVICAVRGHFVNYGMAAFVIVEEKKKGKKD